MIEHKFITYVRTCQFRKYKFRNIDVFEPVFIAQSEIQKKFFPFPKYDLKSEIQLLIDSKELEVSSLNLSNGNKAYCYKALKRGQVDLSMLEPKGKELDSVHKQMMNYLKDVSLSENAPNTLYFNAFLLYKETNIRIFFTVDEFSNRVHTPVTNFHRTHRPNILLKGEKTTSLDVATMQPLLLGKILKKEIGANEYSNWINSGKDIYVMLQEKAQLKTRDEAKKRFFEILFAPANNKLAVMFGASNWINWINDFKRKPLLSNPHTHEKEYSNLAWLLQTTEVKVMYKVWYNLIQNNIPFLSVHDEIIIKEKDLKEAEHIFRTVLEYEFEFFMLNNNAKSTIETTETIQPTVNVSSQNQTNISKETTLIFSKYFKGFDNYFLEVVNGAYSINNCIIDIKGLYNYSITENEFIQLLISKRQHFKKEYIINSKINLSKN